MCTKLRRLFDNFQFFTERNRGERKKIESGFKERSIDFPDLVGTRSEMAVPGGTQTDQYLQDVKNASF